jgi:hypothetical protein
VPWKETSVMDERIKFLVEYLQGEGSIASLCREFGGWPRSMIAVYTFPKSELSHN